MNTLRDLQSLQVQVSSWADKCAETLPLLVDRLQEAAREKAHFLVPDMEHLGEHEQRTPAEIYVAMATLARLSRMDIGVRQELDAIRGRDYLAAQRHLLAAGVTGGRGAPTEKMIEAWMVSNPSEEQTQARRLHADLQEQHQLIEAQVQALRVKASLLPGLQRRRNDLWREGV